MATESLIKPDGDRNLGKIIIKICSQNVYIKNQRSPIDSAKNCAIIIIEQRNED